MSRQVSVVAVAFLLLQMLALPAMADSFDALSKSDQSKFRSLLDKCIAEYDKGRFDKAEALCGQAAELTPHPATRYLVARIRDREGKCETAVATYSEVLNEAPAGLSEARWVEEYRKDLESHLAALGDCSARIDAKCAAADQGAIVSIDGTAVGRCPGLAPARPGSLEVVLSAQGKQSASKTVSAQAGRPVSVEFAALKTREEPSGGGTVRVTCEAFPDGALITVGGAAVGICPLTIALPAGTHRIAATTPDGERGAVSLDVDPEAAEQPAVIVPFHRVQLTCVEPDVRVQLEHDLLDGPIDATCGDLASTGLLLPKGTLVVRLSKEQRQPREATLEVGEGATLAVGALEHQPVAFTVNCADTGEPPVFVRIAGHTGPCPLAGEAPEGAQILEARREGYAPLQLEVTLQHGAANALEVPPLEAMAFWTPGVITSVAAGTVVLTAVIVDVAGLGALDDLEDISKGNFGVCGSVDPRTCYDDRKATVESTILWTRILYGVGIAGLAAGAGLIVWEHLESAPGAFDNGDGAVSLVPLLGPTAEGGAQFGLSLGFSF